MLSKLTRSLCYSSQTRKFRPETSSYASVNTMSFGVFAPPEKGYKFSIDPYIIHQDVENWQRAGRMLR